MRWPYLLVTLLLLLPLQSQAQGISNYRFKTQVDQPQSGRACYSFCLSRGGLHHECDQKCRADDTSEASQLLKESAEDVKAAEHKPDASYEAEPIGKRVVIDHKAQMSGESRNFDGINYNCFKTCRIKGDSFEACSMICSE